MRTPAELRRLDRKTLSIAQWYLSRGELRQPKPQEALSPKVCTIQTLGEYTEYHQHATELPADKPSGPQDGQRQRNFTEKISRNNMWLCYLLRRDFYNSV